MTKGKLLLAVSMSCLGMAACSAVSVAAADGVAMYRMYNPNSGEHFYTASVGERNHLVSVGWNYEGGAWTSPKGGQPVYRLYNPNAGDHHYTTSLAEKNFLVSVGWNDEKIGWYSGGDQPVYRLYNPNAKKAGAHHYTLSRGEYDHLDRIGWNGENIGWYAVDKFTAADVEDVMNAYSPSRKPKPTPAPTPAPSKPQEDTKPRPVDVDITGVGGAEDLVNGKGSYRLLYSNKAFDVDPAVVNGMVPTMEFSADMELRGAQKAGSDYGMQFIIAGPGHDEGNTHIPGGQIGLDIGYQDGGSVPSAAFAQSRISVKTVNFPMGAGIHGEQYYSVNTSAENTGNASISVQYYNNTQGEFLLTYFNGRLVGCYRTKLYSLGTYILHAQVDSSNSDQVTLRLRNVSIKKNGVEVLKKQIVEGDSGYNTMSYVATGKKVTDDFTLVANTSESIVHGAFG